MMSNSWIPFAVRLTPWAIFALLFGLLVLLFLQWDSLESRKRIQTTNNAYVYFDNVVMEAKVSGYVKKGGFSDFQEVAAGTVLVSLVDDDFRMAVNQAEAQQRYAQATLDKLQLEEEIQKASVEQAKATLSQAETNAAYREREYGRIASLLKEQAVSESDADTAENDLKTAKADLDECKASYAAEQQKLILLDRDRELRTAELDQAKAALSLAQINLSYTELKAPVNCTTGACKIHEGELVKTGTVIATLTPQQLPYIIANFKETQLARIQVGESVSMTIDTFPDHKFKGRVSGISPATGATYSLVPVDRSAGNFTKVVQRIPVRIELDREQPFLDRLRAGMSAVTATDTHSTTKARMPD